MLTATDYLKLASQCYSDKPTYGDPDSSGRAIVYGDAVGFPGTNNIECWLADLNVDVLAVAGMGRIHKGFWDSFQLVSKPLMNMKGVNVTLGHSEGAALALIYGAQLCIAGMPPKAIYAFEAPRVTCDGKMQALFKKYSVKLLITQHGNDVVPMVPRLLHDWQHPGELTYFGKADLPFPNVQDHLMDGLLKDFPPQLTAK
ncbi:MAG: lipase [Rhodospirillales bacterium 20-64-7]|nr:MAG: lipase [Rhodospirillales bacterium 20-64-7]